MKELLFLIKEAKERNMGRWYLVSYFLKEDNKHEDWEESLSYQDNSDHIG